MRLSASDNSGGDDADILRGLRLRDAKALERIAERYGNMLAESAFAYLGDRHEAEDLSQETLIQCWDAARRMADNTRLKPWLMGILMNQCRKHRRSFWRRLRRERLVAQMRQPADTTDVDTDERLERLKTCLKDLNEDLVAVVILRYQRRMSVAETAEALGIPEGTVKTRTHVALQKLRFYMERQK